MRTASSLHGLLAACLLWAAVPTASGQATLPSETPATQADNQTSPAEYVRQAARAWDGTDSAPAPQEARRLLALAIEGYRALAAKRPHDTELAEYIPHLEGVLSLMEEFTGFDAATRFPQEKDLQGFSPTFLGLELLALPDTDATSLRRRLTCIQAHMEGDRPRYLLSPLCAPDLRYVEITATNQGGPNHLGLTSWFADATSFGAKMEFYMSNLPPDATEGDTADTRLAKKLRRALNLDDTLAHELTHIYFCSRYPKISKGEEDDIRRVYEGHAICVAYAFVRDVFFRGDLSPEQYASFMLSPRYTRYFQWYRSTILTPEGDAQWATLDAMELGSGAPSSYHVRTRTPHTSFGRKARPCRYFGKH